MNYLISIVITAYNVESTITKAVESALSQTWDNIEVIVVEDCSTDSTLSILDELWKQAHKHSLKIIKNTENVGAGMSRRIGIENASGEYVLTLDGDDYLEDNFIESLLNGGEDADIISGGLTVVDQDGKHYEYKYPEHVNEGIDKIVGFMKEDTVFINNKLIRRKLYEEHPYSSRRFIEDIPTIVPILYDANKVKYVESIGYYYVQRKESLCHESNQSKWCLFRGLSFKALIEWAEDKPRAYRNLFLRGYVLKCGQEIMKQPHDEIIAVSKEFPDEWKEFLDYLAYMEELRFSLLAVSEK